MKNTYDLFTGNDLEIAELIQQRRLQLLIHSYLYYEMNQNIIPDKVWDEWAKELVRLQTDYPNIAKMIIWHDAFQDWDGSSGAFLPLQDEWVQRKAKQLYGSRNIPSTPNKIDHPVSTKKNVSSGVQRLF